MVFTEYHHICATMIQQQWKRYLLKKTFNRIHCRTTHFKTMVINTSLEITYNGRNSYGVYDISAGSYKTLDFINTIKTLREIEKIHSLKLQSIVCDLNPYNYPEFFQVSVF